MLWHAMLYRLSWAKLPVYKDVSGERTMAIAAKAGQSVRASGTRCVAVAKGKNSSAEADGYNCLAIAEGEGSSATASGNQSLVVTFGKGTTATTKYGAWHLHLDPDAEPGKQAIWIKHEEKKK